MAVGPTPYFHYMIFNLPIVIMYREFAYRKVSFILLHLKNRLRSGNRILYKFIERATLLVSDSIKTD